MGTNIRSELSEKNKYWIPKHRYYELKHFCMQYSLWKKIYNNIDGYAKASAESIGYVEGGEKISPTERGLDKRLDSKRKIDMLEGATEKTDPVIGKYILDAVTEGYSYDFLKMTRDIPCSKGTYYELYRRFFWILDSDRK